MYNLALQIGLFIGLLAIYGGTIGLRRALRERAGLAVYPNPFVAAHRDAWLKRTIRIRIIVIVCGIVLCAVQLWHLVFMHYHPPMP